MKLSSLDGNKIKGVAVFKHTLTQETFSTYVNGRGILDLISLNDDLRKNEINQPLQAFEVLPQDKPLTGQALLERLKECEGLGKQDLVRACGYFTVKSDDTELYNYSDFYDALLDAKLSNPSTAEDNNTTDSNVSNAESPESPRVKSLNSLFNSTTYGEVDWLYTAPLLEQVEISSNALNIKGEDLISSLNPDAVVIEPFTNKGSLEEGLIHICVELALVHQQSSLTIDDSFNEGRYLLPEDKDFLRVCLIQNPSGHTYALDTVYSERDEGYYGSPSGSIASLLDRKDWLIDQERASKIYIIYADASGERISCDIGDSIAGGNEICYDFENSTYINPSEIASPPIKFSINIGYCEGKYPEPEDFDDLDEDCLTEFMEGAGDDFTLYETKLVIEVDGEQSVILSDEHEPMRQAVLRPREGRIMVYTDSRQCTFSGFPDDYGSDLSPDHGWECEPLKKDILRNKIQLNAFRFISESPRNMYWEYKDVPVNAWISCDVSSEEKVEVLENGSVIMTS